MNVITHQTNHTNLEDSLRELEREYGSEYKILKTRRRFFFQKPFFLRRRYVFEIAVTEKVTKKDELIAILKNAKKRRRQNEKEKLLKLTNKDVFNASASETETEIKEKQKQKENPKEIKNKTKVSEEEKYILDYLVSEGVKPDIVQEIIDKVKYCVRKENETLKDLVTEEIKKTLKIKKKNEGRITAFCGPTGVGKTTTVVKFVNKNKKEKNHVISTDNNRIGAYEEMERYAEKYKFSFTKTTLKSKEEIKELNDKTITKIWIDSEGINPKNDSKRDVFKEFYDRVKPDQIILVISATQKYNDMLKTIKAYENMGIDSLLITKLDETDEVGFIVNLAVDTDLPISYFANGQKPTVYLNEFTASGFTDYLWRNFKAEANESKNE